MNITLNKKLNTYSKKMLRWTPSKIKSFVEKHQNFQHSKVFNQLLYIAGHLHLRDVSAGRVN